MRLSCHTLHNMYHEKTIPLPTTYLTKLNFQQNMSKMSQHITIAINSFPWYQKRFLNILNGNPIRKIRCIYSNIFIKVKNFWNSISWSGAMYLNWIGLSEFRRRVVKQVYCQIQHYDYVAYYLSSYSCLPLNSEQFG